MLPGALIDEISNSAEAATSFHHSFDRAWPASPLPFIITGDSRRLESRQAPGVRNPATPRRRATAQDKD